MKKVDTWSGLNLLVFAALICWRSTYLPYGSAQDPGPGFFPLWLSLILGTLSIGMILKAAKQKEGAKSPGDLLREKIRWGKVLAVFMALVFYYCSLNLLGFVIVTFLFLAFLLRFIDPQPWKAVIGWAVAGSLGCYLIFEVVFRQRLPKGPLWGG